MMALVVDVLLQFASTWTAWFFRHTTVSLRCCCAANLAFWCAGSFNLWMDRRQHKHKDYYVKKLQPHAHLSQQEQADIILLAGFNMLVVAPLICCPLFEFLWQQMQNVNNDGRNNTHRRLTDDDPWDVRTECLLKFPLHMMVTEIAFYTAHYVMHVVPWIYRHVHKVHHRFTHPTAMACAYAHPMEFTFGNVLPIALGPMLTNAHPNTAYIWFAMAMLSTCKGHCGYDVANAATHDAHHQDGRYNFGVLHLMDALCGTTLPRDWRKAQTKKTSALMQ